MIGNPRWLLRSVSLLMSRTHSNTLSMYLVNNDRMETEHRLHAVLRDNAPDMVNSMKLIEWKSGGSFLHTLQLILTQFIFEQSGVKLMMTRANKLLSHFKHSPKAISILHKHQNVLNNEDGELMPCNNLILG